MLKVENRSFGQAGKRIKHPCVEKNETVHCLATVTFTAGRQGNKTYKMLREGGKRVSPLGMGRQGRSQNLGVSMAPVFELSTWKADKGLQGKPLQPGCGLKS